MSFFVKISPFFLLFMGTVITLYLKNHSYENYAHIYSLLVTIFFFIFACIFVQVVAQLEKISKKRKHLFLFKYCPKKHYCRKEGKIVYHIGGMCVYCRKNHKKTGEYRKRNKQEPL